MAYEINNLDDAGAYDGTENIEIQKAAGGTNSSKKRALSSVVAAAVAASGTVTSVSGTADRITSTGGATPVIDIAAAFEAAIIAAAEAAAVAAVPKVLVIAASDEITPITATANKVTFRMPYAMTLTAVRASLTTAQTSGSIFTVDIHDSGTTILSTKITIDNGETTSTTAATPPVISDSALADNAVITIDVDQIGDGTAKGLKVYLIGT